MASFASSATTCGARKHAWTNWDPVYERKHGLISVSIHLFQTTTNHDSQSTDGFSNSFIIKMDNKLGLSCAKLRTSSVQLN